MQNIIKQNLTIGGLSLLLTGLALAAPVFTPDSQPTGWVSKPAVTFFDLSSGTESFFHPGFSKATWAGDVFAHHINSTARVQTTGPWDGADPTLTTAATLLDSANYDTGRKIATLGRSFRWANLTAAEQTAIGSEAILDFVRGDRSNEYPSGLGFRKRESVVGDVMHSTLHYWNHGTNQSLYAGSNDGMLHAFDANTGVENFAYIPSMLIPKLNKLTATPYVHTYFVDGPMCIANLDVSGSRKTILVSGLGAGGAGLFALDISTATAGTETDVANKALWEITATGSFSDLGHTYGTPVFTRLADGTAAVVVGNGYVNTGSGHAVLYIINAVTGALISAIDTGSGSSASPNGLSSPTLYDTDGDGQANLAYAGDIDGNLWKFNLNSPSSSLVLTTSPAQAISSAPVVHAHPLGGQMITFATGRVLTSGDKTDVAIHHAYGIWDGAPVANDQLLTQTLSTSNFGGDRIRTVTNNPIDYSDGSGHHKGWKVALPPGERVVGEKPFYNNGRFYFLSTNPTVELGENWLNELVFTTGGSPLGPIFDLNQDGYYNDSDLAVNGEIPVSKYLGFGVFSQPLLVNGPGRATTLYAFHPDLPVSIPDRGVSGGHFDFDIYYVPAAGKDAGNYAKVTHKHEYDDTFDVTGVNMLNASIIDFNLDNAIPDPATQFKVLVMNQYLNPAALISVGGTDYQSIRTYEKLASETDAVTLLGGLPTYTRDNIDTLVYNLPLDAFKSKDWWGDGGVTRAGLIPTQTGCVDNVNADGSMVNEVKGAGKSKGKIGPNGERFNGALTIQIIRSDTPGTALELNGSDVKYGWRVKQADFRAYVLAEYTSFWHHANKLCYGDDGWIPDPPEDFVSDKRTETPAPGSADPKDGVFGGGLAVVDISTTVVGNVTTTITTYADGSQYIKIETLNDDGTITVYQRFRDGSESTDTRWTGDGGKSGFIDPNKGSPEEDISTGDTGRQSWRDLID